MTPVEMIHAAATALEGQAIGLKERIGIVRLKPSGRWPDFDVARKESELGKLRQGYLILKYFVLHPEQIPPGLAAYLEDMRK